MLSGANTGDGGRERAISEASRALLDMATIARQPWGWLCLILSINIALVGLIVFLDLYAGIDNWSLVRDPNAIARQPTYYGFYSNLGVLLWVTAASTALFAALCLRISGFADGRILPLALGGLFCAVSAIDDFFMLHENSYLIGIPEIAVMSGYALLIAGFTLAALPIALRTNWIFLIFSLFFLALSTMVDVADMLMPGSVLLEEGCKFFGIAFLSVYLMTMSFSAVMAGFEGKP